MRTIAKHDPGRKRPPRLRPHDQAGFALVELVVSAAVMVAIAGGALTALQSTDRTTAEERHRARAHGIAQEDQARLRSFRISALSNLGETRTVTQDSMTYTVSSSGEFVTDQTGTASCEQATASADYIKISSSVTWPSIGARPPVLLQSIVAPPNGAVAADRGALAIAVRDGQGQGVPGVGLAGTGAGSFSGSTGENGCAIFGNLPEGNYTLTPSAAGMVDRDGDPPSPQTVSVVGQSTNTVVLQYDEPGSVNVSFTTRIGGPVPSSSDTVVVFNTGMTEAKAFGAPGSPASTVSANPLFPFASPDTVYAGSCEGNNPNPTGEANPPGAAAMASVVIPAGGSANATIQLPALHLTVRSGTGPADPGIPVSGARVRVSDQNCSVSGQPVRRTFTTNALGQLPDPGLPWSVYDVCADDGANAATATGVTVQDLANGTTRDLYVGGGSPGTCP